MIRKIKGISLLEVLLVSAVGAIIITAAVRYFVITRRNMPVARAIQQIRTLTKLSYEWLEAQKQDDFSDANQGTTISMRQLVNAGLIENTPRNTKDPWGGKITIEPGSDSSHVKITLIDLPQKACKNLARRLDAISNTTMPDCSNANTNYSGEF